MCKEFEEWDKNRTVFPNSMERGYAEAAWNASKQYWLDKNISQRECYQRGHKAGFNQGIDKAVEVVATQQMEHANYSHKHASKAAGYAIEAIKELKK